MQNTKQIREYFCVTTSSIATTNQSSYKKTRLNALSCGIKISTDRTDLYSVLFNSRVWQTDGQTDEQTDRFLIARPRLHSMQRDKNECM